ncbi:MAG: class II aldolase/adducin family protein [Alphaproteobacteria bacterium]|nr:class II aldolase/adducin family protein [Alphaproteobacteria bacterium]
MDAMATRIPSGVRESVSAAEWQARVDLAACYRLVNLYGWDEMIANHISVRVPGEEGNFLLNPYGYLYDQMNASCFVKVDEHGKALLDPTGLGANKAGFVIHSAVHMARHDVDCVIHTHSLAGMAVSAMECGLLPIAQSSMRFADIAYHEFEGPALNMDERARLVADLGDREVMILRNHGLLVTGTSIAEAFNNLFRLERACELQVMTLSCNTPLRMPSREAVVQTNRVFAPTGQRRRGVLEWPALMKRLDGIDPSYRE